MYLLHTSSRLLDVEIVSGGHHVVLLLRNSREEMNHSTQFLRTSLFFIIEVITDRHIIPLNDSIHSITLRITRSVMKSLSNRIGSISPEVTSYLTVFIISSITFDIFTASSLNLNIRTEVQIN